MRIFVLLSRVPYPLEKGDKLRAFNQIKELSKNNEIILCALNPVSGLDEKRAFSVLRPYCHSVNFLKLPLLARLWNMFMAFITNKPFQVGYFYNRQAAGKIKKLINQYNPDHIYCQFVRTIDYVKDIDVSKTLDFQDVLSYGVKRRLEKASFLKAVVFRMEYRRLCEYEKKAFDYFDNLTIISIPDRNLIPHPEKEKIEVIPNGVDHDFFKPMERNKEYDIVFTGNMAYPPNVDAAGFLVNDIMPLVWKKIPEAKVMLAGASPARKVTALKSSKVIVSGWLDDIRDSYSSSKIFIAPMRIGTGLQNKLLEAMSMKVPTITTPLANAALSAKDGEEILIGETARQLAEQIIRLLSNKKLQNLIAEKGYDFVHRNHSWESATKKLGEIINHT